MINSILFIYLFFSLVLTGFYPFIIGNYMIGWAKIPVWKIPNEFISKTKISVVIPARNEEDNILLCIQSILRQEYPEHLLQIIVIDDHSEDLTPERVRSIDDPRVQLISLKEALQGIENQSFKKQAITVGIRNATGDLIMTTDADCITPPDWLNLMTSYYETHHPVFIAAPVNFYQEKNVLECFQSLDFLGMMCITGAGIQQGWMNMCNGANLAYPKEIFYAVEGFKGIEHLASGDDMLLMQKIAQHYPNRIGFIKNKAVTVRTEAKPTLKSFLNQRIRWASKSTAYPEWKVTVVLALVFFFCCNLFLSLCLGLFYQWQLLGLLCVQLFIKAFADFVFLKKMAVFFDRGDLMRFFAPAFFLHTAYIIVVGVLGNVVKKYEWKGRKVY